MEMAKASAYPGRAAFALFTINVGKTQRETQKFLERAEP